MKSKLKIQRKVQRNFLFAEFLIIINPFLLIGTESETKAFMAVCIETAKRYNLDDYRTPVFIFERLCSIIYPVSDLFIYLFRHFLTYPLEMKHLVFTRVFLSSTKTHSDKHGRSKRKTKQN